MSEELKPSDVTDQDLSDTLNNSSVNYSLQQYSAAESATEEAEEAYNEECQAAGENATVDMTVTSSKKTGSPVDPTVVGEGIQALSSSMKGFDNQYPQLDSVNTAMDKVTSGETLTDEDNAALQDYASQAINTLTTDISKLAADVQKAVAEMTGIEGKILDKISKSDLNQDPDKNVNSSQKISFKDAIDTLLAVLKFLSPLLLAAGVYLILWLLSKGLSGCYQINKTDRIQLHCINDYYNDDTATQCACATSGSFLTNQKLTRSDINNYCTSPSVGTDADNPICKLVTSVCSGPDPLVCTTNNSVYYQYKDYTPESLLSDMANNFLNLLSNPGNVLKKILMIVLYIFIAIIAIIIVYFTVRYGFPIINSKLSKKTKQIEQKN
jgi:hypothetical protein